MKTEWQIQMDYNKAMDAARRLRGIATGMDNEANDMDRTINAINRAWDGENSEKYIAKGYQVKNKITATSAGIRRVADAIEQIATRTRDAELAAIRIAEN